MKTIEDIAEVVEKVVEIVDKVAEEISDDVLEGWKVKKAVDIVAEATAEDARTVGDVIDKLHVN
ncbi:hypothetical protein C2S52_000532 [Perilla frutescens var. hirtella]|nr:hypothetical protein C2S52_000532 [Perilla frutescens var. hirtella]